MMGQMTYVSDLLEKDTKQLKMHFVHAFGHFLSLCGHFASFNRAPWLTNKKYYCAFHAKALTKPTGLRPRDLRGQRSPGPVPMWLIR